MIVWKETSTFWKLPSGWLILGTLSGRWQIVGYFAKLPSLVKDPVCGDSPLWVAAWSGLLSPEAADLVGLSSILLEASQCGLWSSLCKVISHSDRLMIFLGSNLARSSFPKWHSEMDSLGEGGWFPSFMKNFQFERYQDGKWCNIWPNFILQMRWEVQLVMADSF